MASTPLTETTDTQALLYLQDFVCSMFSPEYQQVVLLSEQGEWLFSDNPTDITGKEIPKPNNIYFPLTRFPSPHQV